MILAPVDYAVLALYIALMIGIGIVLSKRASRNTEEYFVSGRSLPWWIIGTSMVATTFAADTPLVVSGLVAQGGIFKNWIWWHWGIGAVFTVFLFARLWNRARITTDAELIEIRYDGKPAAALRFYRAAWFGVFQNVLIIAWVMKAMAKIILTVTGWDGSESVLGINAEVFTVLCLFAVAVAYTVMSGLWGVVMTDLLQFALAMGGSVYLAVVAYRHLGGIARITEQLSARGYDVESIMRIIPESAPLDAANPFTEFLLLMLVVWWASYQVDGGGYLSQRMFAAKSERHSVFGYLWFCVAHVALRPWPWIVAGLCGMAMFGKVADPETYYPMLMRDLLGPGALGFMIASFFAAFMSTIDTQLNWGSSLVVNDILRRFLWKGRSDGEYVQAAKLSVLGLALLGAAASFAVKDISMAWRLVISVTAGVGSVYIARWYWWRVNAWSEISVMAAAMTCTFVLWLLSLTERFAGAAWLEFPFSTALTAGIAIAAWVAATFMTKPVGAERLASFYRRVRPGGPGWEPVKAELSTGGRDKPGVPEGEGIPESGRAALKTAAGIVCGIVLTGGMLLGIGRIVLGRGTSGILFLAAAAAAGAGIFAALRENRKG